MVSTCSILFYNKKTHNPQPTTYNPQPTTHNLQPTTHNPQPYFNVFKSISLTDS